jgi:hypothetical protein
VKYQSKKHELLNREFPLSIIMLMLLFKKKLKKNDQKLYLPKKNTKQISSEIISKEMQQ